MPPADSSPENEGTLGPYRIQVVAELTGVPASTLRAWERRYGIPQPRRTDSAYRLYSAEDVTLIRRIQSLCEAGLSVGQAAERVREPEPKRTPGEGAAILDDAFAAASRRIVEATVRFAPEELEAEIQRCTLLGDPLDVFERIYQPALLETGRLWGVGALSVAQEHVAAGLMETAGRDLLRVSRPAGATRRAVVACWQEEQHVLPLIGVALAAQSRGFHAVVLGARTPPSAVGDAVRALRPDLVCLSITSVSPGAHAHAVCAAYAEACGKVPWVVGGTGAPNLRRAVEASGGSVALPDEGSVADALERAVAKRAFRPNRSLEPQPARRKRRQEA